MSSLKLSDAEIYFNIQWLGKFGVTFMVYHNES